MKIEIMSDLAKQIFCGKETSLPPVPWKATDVIKMIIVTGIVLYLVLFGMLKIAIWYYGEMVIGEFFDMSSPSGKQHLTGLLIFGMAFQIIVEMTLLFFYSRWKYHTTLADFGFRMTPVRSTLAIGFFLFFLVYIGDYFFQNFLENIQKIFASSGINFSFYNGSASESLSLHTIIQEKLIPNWILVVFAGLIAPITEELIFRGYLLPSVMKHMGYIWGVIISSAIFAIVHMVFEPITLLIMFLLGCMLSVIYIRTKSLWPGIIFHSINNTIGITLAITGVEVLNQ